MIKVFNWLFRLQPIQFLQGIMRKTINFLFHPNPDHFLQGIGFYGIVWCLPLLLAFLLGA